ncbi:unnamed protein product [Spirodela intermedia]|uniref:Homeobox-leucine zipper protein n=1 Tax=Spirodela intermedia TaxID=51605 RepID=A0A7I8L2J0_SPIIN|nr:unnamed protein product [Spirodela intermedia]
MNRRTRRRRKKAKAGEEAKKRRLSEEQVKFLEMNFDRERKLESGRKARLAAELGLDPKQVAVWFQNRRARWKSKQIEEEYVRLQYMHDAVLVDKSQLEAEVVKLKEQLSEAEKEIAKLSASCSERCSGSPISSSSMEAHKPLLGEPGAAAVPSAAAAAAAAEEDLVLYMHEDYGSYVDMMDWVELHGM